MPAEPALKLHGPAESTVAVAPLGLEPTDTGRLIGQPELFRRLAVSKATGARLRAAGKIGPASFRLGCSLRYSLAEVLAWMQQRRPDGSLHDVKTWPAVWAAHTKTRR